MLPVSATEADGSVRWCSKSVSAAVAVAGEVALMDQSNTPEGSQDFVGCCGTRKTAQAVGALRRPGASYALLA